MAVCTRGYASAVLLSKPSAWRSRRISKLALPTTLHMPSTNRVKMEIAMCVFTLKKKWRLVKGNTRFGFDIKFRTEDKEAFVTRLESIRDLMTPSGSAPLDKNALMYVLFDMAENHGAARRSSHTHTVGSFLEHSGVFL